MSASPFATLPVRRRALAAAVCLLGMGGLPGAMAQQASEPDYSALALKWARDNARHALPASPQPLRLDVSVGALDPRLKLAPCGNIEAYLPPGSRLWGRSRVALRCVDGMARWNVSLPVTVKAFGPAWVARTQLAVGATLNESDVVQAEVDWAEDPNPVVVDASQWLGQMTTRVLPAGQAVRQGAVRPATVFQAGASVRVLAQGAGFQISGDGQALSAGVLGQSARVRLESGRVTSGRVLDARTVQIDI